MLFVAFLRNVNLGQLKSPTRAQLESAFLRAGASTAESFLSNGTLVYSVARARLAQSTANHAGENLSRLCSMNEPTFTYSFRQLARFVADNPFVAFDNVLIAECAVSFFAPMAIQLPSVPLESARKDCLVFRLESDIAFSITRDIQGKTGYPTPVLEKALKRPVTTRSWTTILRLIKKHS